MKKKINIRLVFVWMCVAFMVGYSVYAMFFEDKSAKDKIEESSQVQEKDIYSGRFDTVLYESDKIICYQDKVVYQYGVHLDNVQKIADRVQGVLQKCPSIENVYVMPVPSQILMNDEKTEEQNMFAQYMEELKLKMPEKGVVLDVLQELRENKSEYIYFNTSDTWTARGSYCGMTVFGEAIGRNVIPIDKYWKYSFNSFKGEMVLEPEISEMPEVDTFTDRVFYYLYPNSNNEVEVIKQDDNLNEYSLKKLLITPSYRNTGMFISSNYLEAIVEGKSLDGKDGDKYLLVVCDDTGKIMVPFLKDYYDGIYVVSVLRDLDFYNKIEEIIEMYNITDMLYIQNSREMGIEGHSGALNEFAWKMVKK